LLVFSTMILVNLSPVDALTTLIRNGFFIEIGYDNFITYGGKYAENQLIKRVLETVTSYDKNFIKSIHMPYDEIDADTVPLEAIVSRMIKWLDFAQEVGASIAVFHTLKTSSNVFDTNLYFFRKIVKEASDRGVMVAIENRLEKELFGSKPQDLKNLVTALGEEAGICLDVGHANITKNLRQFIDVVGNQVIELHLHDNDGSKDLHKPPYTGSVDWNLVTEFIKRRKNALPVFEVLCRESPVHCIVNANTIRKMFEI